MHLDFMGPKTNFPIISCYQFCLQAKKASRRTQKKENTMKQARKIAIKYFPSQQYVFSRCLGW